jgi:GT2 family glycosyltransferase
MKPPNFKMQNVDLSIIIVNWNGREFLPNCLKSIVKNSPNASYEIVVVDNNSTDGSAEWFDSGEARKLLDGIKLKLIVERENLGFGKANNLAIEQTESPYIFLLNPDTILKPNAIDLLIEALDSDKTIGATAPKHLNGDETLQPSVWYYPPTPLKIILENFRIYKLLPKNLRAKILINSHWAHDTRKIVPIVWGSAMMFKKDVLKRLKGFDPDFEMYGEDMDLCVRLAKLGFDLVFIPNAEIIHFGGQSAIQHWNENTISLKKIQTGILFEKKHLHPLLFYSNCLTRILVEAIRIIIYPVIGRSSHNSKKILRLHLDCVRNTDNAR